MGGKLSTRGILRVSKHARPRDVAGGLMRLSGRRGFEARLALSRSAMPVTEGIANTKGSGILAAVRQKAKGSGMALAAVNIS